MSKSSGWLSKNSCVAIISLVSLICAKSFLDFVSALSFPISKANKSLVFFFILPMFSNELLPAYNCVGNSINNFLANAKSVVEPIQPSIPLNTVSIVCVPSPLTPSIALIETLSSSAIPLTIVSKGIEPSSAIVLYFAMTPKVLLITFSSNFPLIKDDCFCL